MGGDVGGGRDVGEEVAEEKRSHNKQKDNQDCFAIQSSEDQ